ncbi:hypothetical protein NKT34_05560 [Paenibacillus polysaccharolyticus]|uniref:hypothetical protein n=1 Tax=Paenibacillus polysaccharolyticus TaxID=582692 RepID=UPI0012B816C8|nr:MULTISPECIES: hypothetical protein [Paenibacillus]MCP1132745.1 hypothetical protein [Paenibacillus polysaccharolyticus]
MDWIFSCHLLSLEAAYGNHCKDHIIVKIIRELCITALLRREHQMNHKRVQREGLQCLVRMKKRRPTGQPAYIAEHVLKRQFKAETPMQ